ncbi:hypothetical protein [Breznakiella homolactica]|uniref:Uncharacterized protein n=1 Tax=Breznakiella homolactica TaxID=2798577 RepID=A0A7T8B8V4_9SPIR|nr:hypothetical protein [Breznakiella homolactica]QQO09004.1 hypothetical protein JFL75_19055 [Breznakiella homolactica]
MAVSTEKKSIVWLVCILLPLLIPHTLSAQKLEIAKLPGKGAEQKPDPVIQVVTDLQDRYNGLNEKIPAMVMLETSGASAVAPGIVAEINQELPKHLVNGGLVKPVSMQKWLTATYYDRKANNPFVLMNALRNEQYTVPLQYICKPFVFRSEDFYILSLSFYAFRQNYYPVTVLRFFESPGDIPDAIDAALAEMNLRLFAENRGTGMPKVLVHNFELEFLKLVALESGEFEFIQAPFITQHGVPLREGDDYFSLIMGYLLSATNLFQVMRPSDFSGYTNSAGIGSALADYAIHGRVQLSEELSILYVELREIRNNVLLTSIRYPLREFTMKHLWEAYREISAALVRSVIPAELFGVVPALSAPGRGLYTNNMFIGWDAAENFVLPKGKHEISTGSYYYTGVPEQRFGKPAPEERSGSRQQPEKDAAEEIQVEAFYIFLDTIDQIFTDREGEYVWNLLNKSPAAK